MLGGSFRGPWNCRGEKTMSKLTARDFKPLPIVSSDDDPTFKDVKAKYVPEEKLEDKLPEPVYHVFAKEKTRGRSPDAWILKVKHKEHKAYAIVSRLDSTYNEVRVVDKHGKTITKNKKMNWDSLD
jgi:hypothetical protein